jgi:NAD(P)-dependent dehydrogenase (short-subunit alcohol dehydrogenase family)
MQIGGSSAIVVGGAGGLGETTVRRLHAAGAKVVIADLADELDALPQRRSHSAGRRTALPAEIIAGSVIQREANCTIVAERDANFTLGKPVRAAGQFLPAANLAAIERKSSV